jgi:hypothetical protein
MQMETERNLANTLQELANLYTSTRSIQRLQQKWPTFLPIAPVFQIKIENRLSTGEIVPLDVSEDLHYVIWLRDFVRQLWAGDSSDFVRNKLEHILLTGKLGWGGASPLNFLNAPILPGIVAVDLRHRRFEYRPQTLLQEALYFLLQNLDKAKVCGNPDCPTPYFIAPRSNTKFCSDGCVEEIKREAKLAWWKSKGNQWREKRKRTEATKHSKKQ